MTGADCDGCSLVTLVGTGCVFGLVMRGGGHGARGSGMGRRQAWQSGEVWQGLVKRGLFAALMCWVVAVGVGGNGSRREKSAALMLCGEVMGKVGVEKRFFEVEGKRFSSASMHACTDSLEDPLWRSPPHGRT